MKSLLLLLSLAAAQGVHAATYYTAKTGRDTNLGTLTAPFLTMRKGMSALRAGDTLYVRAGTYAETFVDGVASGSSWSAPTTVAAYPNERVVIAPASGARIFHFTSRSYVVLDGFIMDGRNMSYNVIKIISPAHHIRVRNSEVMNAPAQGILAGVNAHSNEFINLKMHDNGSTQKDYAFYANSSNNLVERCDIYANSGKGLQIYTGYAGESANNNIIRYNKIHDNARLGERGVGLNLTSGSGNMAHDNLIWNNAGGIQVNYRAVNTKVYNNTIFKNTSYGIYLGGSDASGAVVRNNIVFQNVSGITNAMPGAVVSNNLTADPLFVDAANSDLKLRAGSPAIDRGYNLASEGIVVDFAGTARPVGAAYDIGAFEYTGTTPAPAPTPTPVGCVSSAAGAWKNVPLPSQSGVFTVTFDATPSAADIDGVIGLSNGAASAYTSLAAAVRFNNTGKIDARKGGAYAAAASIPYAANVTYRFRLVVDLAAHTYSAYVKQGTSAEQSIGSGYAFRTEQGAVMTLNNLGLMASSGSEIVCNAAATASAAPAAPAGCLTSAAVWRNVALPSRTGSFTLEFDAIPAAADIDGVAGVSNGAASAYTALACAVRFNNAGRIDARNGGAYAAAALIPYSAQSTYHFRLVISLSAHTYSVYVREGGSAEKLIGSNYAFRTEQGTVSVLNNLGLFSSVGSATVCNAAVK